MEGNFFQALELAVGALCPGCGNEHSCIQGTGKLCGQCQDQWPKKGSGACVFESVELCRTGLYQGSLRHLILRAKATIESPAFHPLYQAFLHRVQEADLQTACLTVPPPSWRRRWQGWHLAEHLAQRLAKDLGWQYQDLLKRKSSRPAQAGLGAHARRNNLKGTFGLGFASRKRLPSQVWIVDDVWTTGATFYECRDVLQRAGVKVLGVLLLAQVDQLQEARQILSEAS